MSVSTYINADEAQNDEDESEENESKIYHINLMRRFLEKGEESTADILLENSASPLLCSHIAVTPCIETLYYIIEENRGNGKCVIALGIIANLFLFPDSRSKLFLETNPSLSQCVIQCMLEESDPFIYSEAFRVLSNIVYFGFTHLILPHLEILATVIKFTVCNSLNLRLLAQTFQFLHFFVREYVSNEDFDTQHSVFHSLMIQSTIFELLTQNREVLAELSQEMIGSCTGIEYFLLFFEDILQYLQSTCSSSDDDDDDDDDGDGGKNYWTLHLIGIEVLLQMVNGSADSFPWEENSAERRPAAGSAFALGVNLKFIALSILNGLLRFTAVSRHCEAAVMRCCMQSLGQGRGFAPLVALVEEALIMREVEAVRSGCAVVTALLSAGRHQESSVDVDASVDVSVRAAVSERDERLLQHLAEWIDPVRSLTSLLCMPETQQWLRSTADLTHCPASELPADIGRLIGQCLKHVKQLLSSMSRESQAAQASIVVVSDIDTYLSLLRHDLTL